MSSRRSLRSEPRGTPPTHRHPHPQQTSSPLNTRAPELSYPPYKNEQASQPLVEESALEKLLGKDSDQYVKERMGDYDRMVDKWSDCTMAEWIAGADGLLLSWVSYDLLPDSFPVVFRNRGQVSQDA